MSTERADIVVIGGGVAGLSAALSAAETLDGGRVLLLEKAPKNEAGGNTRWTDAYFRLEDIYEPAPGFVEDMLAFSRGKTDEKYVHALVENLPEAMEWVQGHGVRFQRRATYFVTASRPRMMPVGGGESLVRHLTEGCEKRQVEIRYDAPVTGIERAADGYAISFGEGGSVTCRACIVACGGFEADRDRLRRHIGEAGGRMKPIAPGGLFNTGEVIDFVLGLGVAAAGEWAGFHGEPVDARSTQPEASIMVFPYGILVNRDAARFIDEGIGTVDETYEDVARAILAQPDSVAFLISDATFTEVPGIERGILSDKRPLRADTLEELARLLGLDPAALRATVDAYNRAVRDGDYDPLRPDGKHTEGLTPPKSNWAMRIERPPFVGFHLTTDIVFTYGGLATDEKARAVDGEGRPVPGLYAAGECTGVYYHKYPGATSVMRGLVFGRIAGREAAKEVGGSNG